MSFLCNVLLKALVLLLLQYRLAQISAEKLTDVQYAKLPKIFALDDYDDCFMKEWATTNKLYCNVEVLITEKKFREQTHQQAKEGEENVWNLIEKTKLSQRYYKHDYLRHGICVSQKCPKAADIYYEEGKNSTATKFAINLKNCLSNYVPFSDFTIKNLSVQNCEDVLWYFPITSYHYLFAIGVALIVSLVIYATFSHKNSRNEIKNKVTNSKQVSANQIWKCLSLRETHKRLMKNNTNLPQFKSFMGLRVIGMYLTISAHSTLFSTAPGIQNTKLIDDVTRYPLSTMLLNGYCAMQIFFIISGWILSYQFFSNQTNNNNLKRTVNIKQFVLIFVNRYLRLTPVLFFVLALQASWLVNFSYGPYWHGYAKEEYNFCRNNGWTNLLYINNIYNRKDMCLAQTWYTAADLQIYPIALTLIYFMKKYEKHAVKIASACWSFSVILLICVNYTLKVDAIMKPYPEMFFQIFFKDDSFFWQHTSMLQNQSSYFIGVLFGYLYFKHKGRNIITTKVREIIWYICWTIMPFCIIFTGNYFYDDTVKHTRLITALYSALYRPLFGLTMAIGLYGFTVKKGGFILRFLENDFFQIIGKLTYCAFLIHSTVIRCRATALRNPVYISSYIMIHTSIGDIVLSFLLAYLLCIFVEYPANAIQKVILPIYEKNVEPDKKSM